MCAVHKPLRLLCQTFKPLCIRPSFAIQRRARPHQSAELLRQLHKQRAEREVGDQTNAFVSLPCSHFPLQPSRRPCRAGCSRCLPTAWQGWARHSQPLPGMLGCSLWAQPDPLLPRELLPAPAPRAPSRSALLGPRCTAALKAGEGKSAELGCPSRLRQHSSSWAGRSCSWPGR